MKILRQAIFSKKEDKKEKEKDSEKDLVSGILIGSGAGATGTALGMAIGTKKIAREKFKELNNKKLPKYYLDLYGKTPQARIALREDARKAAIAHKLSKGAAIGLGSAAIGTAGYGAYKYYRNKKKESNRKEKE